MIAAESSLPMLASMGGGFAAPLKAGKYVSPIIAALTSGATDYGQGRAEGLSPDNAGDRALGTGIIEGLTEFLPSKYIFDPQTGSMVARVLKGIGTDVAGEQVATAGQGALATTFGQQDPMRPGQALSLGNYAAEQLPREAVDTLAASVFMAPLTGGATLLNPPPPDKKGLGDANARLNIANAIDALRPAYEKGSRAFDPDMIAEGNAGLADPGIAVEQLPIQDIEAAPAPAERQQSVDEALVDMAAQIRDLQQRPSSNIDVENQQFPVQHVEAAPPPPQVPEQPFPPAPTAGGIDVQQLPVQDVEAAPAPLNADVVQGENVEAPPIPPPNPIEAAVDEIAAQMRPPLQVENLEPTEINAARATEPNDSIGAAFGQMDAAEIEGAPRLSRNGRPQNRRGADPGKLQTAFDAITSRLKGAAKVRVVPTLNELPAAVRQKMTEEDAKGVDGVYYEGEVWMVADELPSPERAAQVYFHETVGHHGLRGLFNVGGSAEGEAAFNKLLDDVVAAYRAGKFDKWFEGRQREYLDLHIDEFPTEREAAEEFIARSSEGGAADPSGFRQRLRIMVTQALRRTPGLGRHFQNVTKAEIDELIARSRRFVEQGAPARTEFRGSRFARNLPGDVRYSRRTTGKAPTIDGRDDELTVAFKLLAGHPEFFSGEPSNEKDMGAIAADKPGNLAVTEIQMGGQFRPANTKRLWTISAEGANSEASVVEQDRPKNTIFIDISQSKNGGGGEQIYQTVAEYAHNNGKVFIGDPSGLSWQAQIRRTEQMLGSALRLGTTKHLGPHELQEKPEVAGVRPINWIPDDDAHNFRELIQSSYETYKSLVPQIADIGYSFTSGKFEKPDGSEYTADDFKETAAAVRRGALRPRGALQWRAGSADAPTIPAGIRSLKRTVFAAAVLRAKAEGRWGEILGSLSLANAPRLHTGMRGALLSRRARGDGQRPMGAGERAADNRRRDDSSGLSKPRTAAPAAGGRLSRTLTSGEGGFYSAVKAAVAGASMRTATAVQWMNFLRNYQGLKREEIEWLGLEQWLQSDDMFGRDAEITHKEWLRLVSSGELGYRQGVFSVRDWLKAEDIRRADPKYKDDGKITQKELLLYIGAHEVNIDELELSGSAPGDDDPPQVHTGDWETEEPDDDSLDLDYFMDDATEWATDRLDEGEELDEEEVKERALKMARDAYYMSGDSPASRTFWFEFRGEQYNGHQTESYGETEVRIENDDMRTPLNGHADLDELALEWVRENVAVNDPGESEDGTARWKEYTLRGGEEGTYRELVLTLPVVNRTVSYTNQTHWPDVENPVLHLRVWDVIKDGLRWLFVEEIQSDWHQAGRKLGYEGDGSHQPATVALKRFEESMERKYGAGYKVQLTLEEAMELTHLGRREKEESLDADDDPVANAPLKGSWVQFGLKRLLKLAVDEGYEGIAWTTGEQQNHRYNYGRLINSINYVNRGDGTFDYVVFGKNGAMQSHTELPVSKLVEHLGPEMALKIRMDKGVPLTEEQKKEDRPPVIRSRGRRMASDYYTQIPIFHTSDEHAAHTEGQWHKIQGEGLLLKGSGLTGYYNKILPADMNKYIKKWGGKVELRDIGFGAAAENEARWPGQALENIGIQPAVRITDKMKGDATKKQSVFSRKLKTSNPVVKMAENFSDGWRARIGDPAWDKLVETIKPLLAAVKLADTAPTEFKQQMRAFRVEVQREGRKIQGVAEQSAGLAPQERLLISDFIERTLASGVVPPAEIVSIATAMRAALADQRDELISMQMLSEDSRDRWGDEYIARYYAKHVMDKPWDKVLRAAHKKIDGSHMRGRGLFTPGVKRADMGQWEALGWESRSDDGVSPTVTMWRDFTAAERQGMGEIRDGVYRFLRGYLESAQDIATGHLFAEMSTASYTRDNQPADGDYVQVPLTTIGKVSEGQQWQQKRNPAGQYVPGRAYRYGKLAGKWVPLDVWEQLAPMFEQRGLLVGAYLDGLALWKEGKTVLNPVVHSNNVVSNAVASYWAIGSDALRISTYRDTFADYRAKGKYYQEAIANGLFGTEYYSAEIAALMPTLDHGTLQAIAKGKVSGTLAFIAGKMKLAEARAAMQRAYTAEDQFYKLLLYRHMRQKGIKEADAIDFAERYVFNYANVPKGVRVAKATGWPFASYTYGAIPMVARTLLQHPERLAATFALLGGVNWLSFTLLGDAGDEEGERKVMPEYMRGRTTTGVQKNIRMPMNAASGAAMYMDISRRIPMGDLFDMNNQAGGLSLPAPMMPNNPLFTLAVGVLANKDMFTGYEIVPDYDQDFPADKGAALAAYFARQMMPNNPAIPGSYSWNKVMNGMAGTLDAEIGPFSGKDYRGRMQSLPRAVADVMLGIKLREVDVKAETGRLVSNQMRLARDIQSDMRRAARDKSLTANQREREIGKLQEKIKRVIDKAKEYRK